MNAAGGSRRPTDMFADALVDIPALGAWLAERIEIDARDFEVRRVSSGHSNEMFLVRSGSANYMLRRPPLVTSTKSANNMAREFRLLSALEATTVPHASPVLLCEDPAVIGAQFMLTRWVDGLNLRIPLPTAFDTAGGRPAIALELIDVLADIGSADWRQIGLSDFGKPAGFLSRQVDRWRTQLASYETRSIPHLDAVAAWLDSNLPAEGNTGLVHGDFQSNNVMFATGQPPKIVAVVDWEGATIGDPLLDLGWFLAMWDHPGEDAADREPAALLSQLPGMPSRSELAERYEARSGRSTSNRSYYEVLALFKLACILEGSYARHVKGQSQDPSHARFATRVPKLIGKAMEIAAGDRD